MEIVPELRIRDYRPGDAAAMARVFFLAVRTLGPRRYAPAQVVAWAPVEPEPIRFAARAADGRHTLVVVGPDDMVVAFGDLEASGHVDLFYCHPDVAGTGIAARLLDALINRAHADGITNLHVEASELARGLFARHGFALVRRRDFTLAGVAIHNYLMTRPVS